MKWNPSSSREREEAVAARLRASSKFYRFLWSMREELFADGFEEELLAAYAPRGQEPCPPAQLALVMLLQRYAGVSDASSVDVAENDRRWQLVLGTLGQEGAPFGQGSLVRFRTRMIANDLDRKLVDRTVELARKTGLFGWKQLRVALDSSPLEGAGRVEDTWNLIGRAMYKVVHAVSLALDVDSAEVIADAKLTVLDASSVKAALDIDWDEQEAQRAALKRLLDEVSRLEAWVARRASRQAAEPPLKDALQLLRRIVDQDTEPDPTGGRSRIKHGVAADRVISVSDVEMRHGHKSKTKLFNGFKRHIALADGVVLATAVEPANLREHLPTPRLVADVSKHGEIAVLDIDRGYLPSPTVQKLSQQGVTINCRPWPSNPTGLFSKERFRIDLRRHQVTCPAGLSAKLRPSRQACFSVEQCQPCRLRPRCTTAQYRTITLHDQEELLARLRRLRRTRTGRAELRKRAAVEHGLARIGRIQGRRARYRGARKNELDLNCAAALANLFALARMKSAA